MNGTRVATVATTSRMVPSVKRSGRLVLAEDSKEGAASFGTRRGSCGVASGSEAPRLSGEAGASRMGGDGLLEEREHLGAEYFAVKPPSVLPQAVAVPTDCLGATHRRDQAVHLLLVEGRAGPPVHGGVECTGTGVRDD